MTPSQIESPIPSAANAVEAAGGGHAQLPVTFVAYREGLGPIFSSVYVTPARRLLAEKFDTRIVTMSAIGEWLRPWHRRRWGKLRAGLEQHLPGRLHRLPCPPNRAQWAWGEAPLLRRWLQRQYGTDRRVILHCGASQATVYALEARRYMPELRVVYQCWGPESAEHIFDGVARGCDPKDQVMLAHARYRDELQKRSMVESDAIISISESMSKWAIDTYGADADRIVECPCFVETDRFNEAVHSRERMRKQLGLTDRFVVVYVGSMFGWQFPDGCFDVIRAVRSRRPDAHFLAVTTSPDAMRSRLQRQGFTESDATILSVPFEEVPSCLVGADLAILGRGIGEESSLVNLVSSPVKYGEYLASGVPVVLSEGIGDFSALTRELGIGVVLEHSSTPSMIHAAVSAFLENYEKNQASIRERCRGVAAEKLSLDVHLKRLATLYQKLATA